MAFRVGHPPQGEEDKNPRVLAGPANKVTGRQIRPRTIRRDHLAPDVLQALEETGLAIGAEPGGQFFRLGNLLICTHVLSSLSSGSETWTFPAAFEVSPTVVATPLSTAARIVTVSGVTATEATIRAWTDAGASANPNVHVIAIGLPAE